MLREIGCAAVAQASLAVPTVDRRRLIGFVGALLAALPLQAGSVSIAVFSLFRPQELIVTPVPGGRVSLSTGVEPLIVEGGRSVRLSRRGVSMAFGIGGRDSVAEVVDVKPSGPARRFVLAVPEKIRREFDGELTVRVHGEVLEAVVQIELETAVAAIVAAEGGDLAPAALEAQAVAARSYLTASTGRHSGYQFCDTTHCQYLADLPPANSAAWRAAGQTRGLVLAYRGVRFAPLYTRSCGGTTHTPADVGLADTAYRYQRVRCPVCSRDTISWSADRSVSELGEILSRPGDENARLEVVRRLGWSAVPSNTYEFSREGDRVRMEGAGEGHGVGLCQRGAAGLAREGWTFREILAYYFPDSSLVELRANY